MFSAVKVVKSSSKQRLKQSYGVCGGTKTRENLLSKVVTGKANSSFFHLNSSLSTFGYQSKISSLLQNKEITPWVTLLLNV